MRCLKTADVQYVISVLCATGSVSSGKVGVEGKEANGYRVNPGALQFGNVVGRRHILSRYTSRFKGGQL